MGRQKQIKAVVREEIEAPTQNRHQDNRRVDKNRGTPGNQGASSRKRPVVPNVKPELVQPTTGSSAFVRIRKLLKNPLLWGAVSLIALAVALSPLNRIAIWACLLAAAVLL